MTNTHSIILNNVCFHFPNSQVSFKQLNLSLDTACYGLVGRNGVGKSTLLKLIAGELSADAGTIQHAGQLAYLPQLFIKSDIEQTVVQVLAIDKVLQALLRISQGYGKESDYMLVDGQWDIEQRLEQVFAELSLESININQPFDTLSGGQKTKVHLARILLNTSSFIMLDEPTNNLDADTRQYVIKLMQHHRKGMLVVSHDRELLNQCDSIIELSTKGLTHYGGNYDFYREQKAIKEAALAKRLQDQQQELRNRQQSIQSQLEKHQQNQAKGQKEIRAQIKAKGQYNKIEMKAKQGHSERSNQRLTKQAKNRLAGIHDELNQLQQQQEHIGALHLTLADTSVPANKVVVDIENVSFAYEKTRPIFNDFSLQIQGPERVALLGKNGSGKSTLIKLLLGELSPCAGNITVGVDHVAYLDQQLTCLQNDLSILDNYLNLNAGVTLFEAYSALATFGYRNKAVEAKVADLSGGEKMRAALAICLTAKLAPQLLILDEPTNHIDLDTITAIESALCCYQGAMIVVSHDQCFLDNIGITKSIFL